jgi:hypothetical protein
VCQGFQAIHPISSHQTEPVPWNLLKALDNLELLATVQGRYCQRIGSFLTAFSMEPTVPQCKFCLMLLKQNGLQIVAQSQMDRLKSFIALFWSGLRSNPVQSGQSAKSGRAEDPWSEFPLITVPTTHGCTSLTVVMNYCQSDRPTQELPSMVLLPNAEPVVYRDFKCPTGYMFAASMTEIAGRLATETLPSFVFKRPH